MKISHIEHLGIAVQSIEESLPFFTDVLGLECYATEVVVWRGEVGTAGADIT